MDFDEDWKIKHENYYLIYVSEWVVHNIVQ